MGSAEHRPLLPESDIRLSAKEAATEFTGAAIEPGKTVCRGFVAAGIVFQQNSFLDAQFVMTRKVIGQQELDVFHHPESTVYPNGNPLFQSHCRTVMLQDTLLQIVQEALLSFPVFEF